MVCYWSMIVRSDVLSSLLQKANEYIAPYQLWPMKWHELGVGFDRPLTYLRRKRKKSSSILRNCYIRCLLMCSITVHLQLCVDRPSYLYLKWVHMRWSRIYIMKRIRNMCRCICACLCNNECISMSLTMNLALW